MHAALSGGAFAFEATNVRNVALQIMRGEFAKNELPTREFKDELAKQLGLCYRQVRWWLRRVRQFY